MQESGAQNPESIRLDKWLWAARFFKTRTLAAEAVKGGRVELNGKRSKPARIVCIGDRLSVRKPPFVHDLQVLSVSPRRGPSVEAAAMYRETPGSRELRERVAAQLRAESALRGGATSGRPTKRNRRRIVRFRRNEGS